MRNNLEEQLENLKQQSSQEIAPHLANQTGLSFVTATEMVELPSKGKFYPPNHPLHNKSMVEIKQMTAKEEDILTNKSFIKKGILLDKLVESLLVDKTIPVESLLVGDKNAIIISARSSAYGPDYNVYVSCLECGMRNLLKVNLEEKSVRDTDAIDKEAETNEKLKHIRNEKGSITFKLPKSGWDVTCKLLNGEDEKFLIAFLETKKKTQNETDIGVLDQLYLLVEGINDNFDKKIIEQAINIMPAYDAKYLRTIYAKLTPNVSLEKRFVCSTCNAVQEMEVPFTQEFFWPKQ